MADLGWEDDDVSWGGQELSSKTFAPVVLNGTGFDILDYDAENPLDASLERRAVLHMPGAFVLGVAIWPQIEGPNGGVIQISLGGHDTPEGAIDWEGPYDFTIGSSDFVDFAVSGRYLAVRFESTGVAVWSLQSYDIDYEILGKH